MNINQNSSSTCPLPWYVPPGRYPAGAGVSIDPTGPVDRFTPSSVALTDPAGCVDRFTPSSKQDDSHGLYSKVRLDDREADAALLNRCGEGCSCTSCSGVGQGEDPLKALRDRDMEVRTHENEHLNNAGEFARGGPVFDMATSRGGQSFAVGGKVNVDISEIANDPKKTIDKMQRLRRAALAPATPSGQDRSVAAEASGKEAEAQEKLNRQREAAIA